MTDVVNIYFIINYQVFIDFNVFYLQYNKINLYKAITFLLFTYNAQCIKIGIARKVRMGENSNFSTINLVLV